MPWDVLLPVKPLPIGRCPNVPMPPLANVVPLAGAPSAAVQAWAKAILGFPLGTVVRDTVEGAPLVGRIECHDWYGADPSRPRQWHKGATIYRLATLDAAGKPSAVMVAPAGWPSSGA